MTDLAPYRKLAAEIGCGDSELMPRIFAMIADQDEARLLLAASPPATVEKLAEESGLPLERVQPMVEPLFLKGLLFKSKKPDATRYYRVRHLGQFHDATVLTPGVSEEYLDLWKQFETTEQVAVRERLRGSEVPRGMRVVPVNVSIESQSQVAAPDDVTRIIEDAERIAVTHCSCRVIHRISDVPLEVCIQINKAADYALERRTGRELSKKEAMEILRMCEEEGLVHCVDNRFEVKHAICNCDAVACTNWRPDPEFAGTFVAPSRFAAELSAEACSVCDICIDRCFFNAISLNGPDETPVVDRNKCVGCGLCMITCPDEAITLEEIRPPDSIPA
jgi:ferredoxin